MIAVIGDVHGCFFTLKELYKIIKSNYKNIPVYCVGDLVDRGNFSADVIDFVIDNNIEFTIGNHDYMYYSFFAEQDYIHSSNWKFNGAESTLRSYENKSEKIQHHIKRMENAVFYSIVEKSFISHAGISESFNKKINDILDKPQSMTKFIKANLYINENLLWNRRPLAKLKYLQIVGHTRQEEINFLDSSDSVYIDTSAFTGNKLSAVIVEDGKIIGKESVPTFEIDIS